METLIRLSTAHAKARLSRNVEAKDAESAIELLQFAIFKKIVEKSKKRRKEDGEETEEEDVEDVTDENQELIASVKRGTSSRKRKLSSAGEVEDDVEKGKSPLQTPVKQKSKTLITVSDERLKQFKKLLMKEFRRIHAQSLHIKDVRQSLCSSEKSDSFTLDELEFCLDKMQEENSIMLSEDIVFLI